MLGKDGRLYDSHFDFDHDGILNGYERAVFDSVVFGKDEGGDSYQSRSRGTFIDEVDEDELDEINRKRRKAGLFEVDEDDVLEAMENGDYDDIDDYDF